MTPDDYALAALRALDRPVMPDGVYEDMPGEEFASKAGLTQSAISRLLISPRHFIDRKVHPERYEQEETPALRFGKMSHCYLIEPDEFDNRYVLVPDDIWRKRTSKIGTANLIAFLEEAGAGGADEDGKPVFSKIVYTEKEALFLSWMRESFEMATTARNLFRGGMREVSVFYHDDRFDIPFKIRPDYLKLLDAGRLVFIPDLKSTVEASYVSFSKSIANFRYDVQAALYIDGILRTFPMAREAVFIDVAFEKSPPFGCAPYRIEPETIEMGRRKIAVATRTYMNCLATGEWPCYPDQIQPITMPRWAINP